MTTTTTRPPVRIPATRNHQLRLRLAAVNRGRAAVRIAEAGRMARAARADASRARSLAAAPSLCRECRHPSHTDGVCRTYGCGHLFGSVIR